MIDPSDGRPRKRSIADEMRKRIRTSVYPPGSVFPSEAEIVQEFGVARVTAREVMRLLVRDGLIVVRHGQRPRVRDTRSMSVVNVPAEGHMIGARPATEAEAQEFEVTAGSPMLVLVEVDTGLEAGMWPADRVWLRQEPGASLPSD